MKKSKNRCERSAAPMTLTVLLHSALAAPMALSALSTLLNSALAAPLLHSAPTIHQGDLHITGHHYYRDTTLSVNGSVILEPAGL